MLYSKLYEKVSNLIDIEEEDKELLKALFKYESIERGESLIEVGENADKAFFILSGYLKYFKMTDSAEEIIVHIYSPDNFAISLKSFFLGTKAEESLQTITACEYLWITKYNLDKLYSISNKWHTFGRKLLESALIEKEERVIDQLTLTGQDKYIKLLENHPDILQNVPVKYIASWIGIKPESLSRIRRIN